MSIEAALTCCCGAETPCCPQSSVLFTITSATLQFNGSGIYPWSTYDPSTFQSIPVQLSPDLLAPQVLTKFNSGYDQRCGFRKMVSFFGSPIVGGQLRSGSLAASGAIGGVWNGSYQATFYAQPFRDPNSPFHALFWEAGLRLDGYAQGGFPPIIQYRGAFVLARATTTISTCPTNRTWLNQSVYPAWPWIGRSNANVGSYPQTFAQAYHGGPANVPVDEPPSVFTFTIT